MMDEAIRRPWWAWPRRETVEAVGTVEEARRGGGDDGPVMIGIVHGPVEIEMARDALAEAGIPAHIKQQSAGSLYGLSIGPLAEAEIWTPRPLAEQARETLVGIGLFAAPEDEAMESDE